MVRFLRQKFSKRGTANNEADAFLAHLPDSIEVRWFREGKFIIGQVNAGAFRFTTQGKNPKDFIAMVNDGVLALFEAPAHVVKKANTFEPPAEAMQFLNNSTVEHSALNFYKADGLALA